MILKMGFKVNMTSFRSQKLWFGHLALYYDYYLTPWINLPWMPSAERDNYQSESSGTENLSDIWSDDGEEKKTRIEWKLGVLFAFEPKAPIPSVESSIIQPGDIGLEEKVVEETTDRTSNSGWWAKFKVASSFFNALLT